MTAELTDEQLFLIQSVGKRYEPALLPEDIKRFPIGQCFDACAYNAAHNPQYSYVEGIAKPLHLDYWILHAWLTDGERAFDPTWAADINGVETPIPAQYVGIEMATADVIAFMKLTGMQGVIANRSLAPDAANTALESRL